MGGAGRKTTAIVLKYYFQPGQEAFREALNAAMPKLLMNGRGPGGSEQSSVISEQGNAAKDATREMLKRLLAKASKKDHARLAELLAKF